MCGPERLYSNLRLFLFQFLTCVGSVVHVRKRTLHWTCDGLLPPWQVNVH